MHERIQGEIQSSLPKKAEIERFFYSKAIQDEVRQFRLYNPSSNEYGNIDDTKNLTLREEE